jgi:hypothetical protein
VHRTLGVVNFPTLYQARWKRAAHSSSCALGRRARRSHDDRSRARQSRVSAGDRRALLGEPDAILLVEFIGDTREARCAPRRTSSTSMGDLGLPGSVVEMTDAGAQKALWECARPASTS